MTCKTCGYDADIVDKRIAEARLDEARKIFAELDKVVEIAFISKAKYEIVKKKFGVSSSDTTSKQEVE